MKNRKWRKLHMSQNIYRRRLGTTVTVNEFEKRKKTIITGDEMMGRSVTAERLINDERREVRD